MPEEEKEIERKNANQKKESIKPEAFNIPISLLAFAEAGYNTVHFFFPFFGSSEAKIFPVAAMQNKLRKKFEISTDAFRNQKVAIYNHLLRNIRIYDCKITNNTTMSVMLNTHMSFTKILFKERMLKYYISIEVCFPQSQAYPQKDVRKLEKYHKAQIQYICYLEFKSSIS